MVGARAWLNPDSDGIWSDSPSAAADALLRAVLPEGAGAVLLGTPEDRRSVIQSALEQLAADRPVYHLHGSAFAAELPYGTLSLLLARAETGPEATWHQVTRVLAELLAPEGSQPALVFISQPQLVDRDSVTVLAQLAQQGRVTLVVQCDRQLDVPADLAALARAGRLQQVAIRPLTPAGTRDLLAAHLGAPVSRVATTVLWRYTGGHPGRLRKVADDCVASGKLRQVRGQWVAAAGPLPRGEISPVHDVVLRRMSGQRRALLEQVAACGTVPVSDLVRDGNGGELDELHAQGIVQVRTTPTGRVAEVQPMWRDRILGGLEPERRRELERRAEEHDPALLRRLRRAEEALACADLTGALDLLGVESASPGRSHLRSASARAMFAAGDPEAADQMVRAAPDPRDPFCCVLTATLAASRGDLPAARHWRAATTRAAAASDLLDAGSPGWNGETLRLWVGALDAEMLSLADDQAGARQAAARVDEQLTTFHRRGVLDAVLDTYDRAMVAVALLETALRCGDLETCRELAEAILTTRHGNPQAVLVAELVLAALELLSGRFEPAGELSTRLAEQAAALGDRHAEAVARLLADFCGAATARDRTVRPASLPTEPLAWGRLGWFGEVIRCLIAAPDPTDDEAIGRAVALADRAAADGLRVVELQALLGAALLGSSDVAARLQVCAAATGSALSGPSSELATAILAEDPAGFCTALTGLAAAGYAGWCHGGVTPAVARLSPADARRLAEVVARQHAPDPDPPADSPPAWMDCLTPREREIAQLVVHGLSNATVARRQGISVRTVEGHLYQVYAKLQVRGRFGLTRLAARSASAHAID